MHSLPYDWSCDDDDPSPFVGSGRGGGIDVELYRRPMGRGRGRGGVGIWHKTVRRLADAYADSLRCRLTPDRLLRRDLSMLKRETKGNDKKSSDKAMIRLRSKIIAR